MTTPAIEDLQPIADKLTEASQKIYEAVELAAQLKLKPRQLTNVCNLIEHIETVQVDLLEAAKRTPGVEARLTNHPPAFGGAIGLGLPRRILRETQAAEEMEKMRAELAEQYISADKDICAMQGDR